MPDEIRTKNFIRHGGYLQICEQHGLAERWPNQYDAECQAVEHNRIRHKGKMVCYVVENPY